MIMSHAGLPLVWIIVVAVFMLALIIWNALVSTSHSTTTKPAISLNAIPLIGGTFRYLNQHTWPLLILKILFAALFLLIIMTGLLGSPLVERNLATALTWNLWWTGIVLAIFFSGSAWCAICPWDNIASWIINQRIWGYPKVWGSAINSLQLKVPKFLRNVWPASLLFIGFTWLELGIGIVASPYATALLALAMLVLATSMLGLFEGKAFCRYMCPVGRTVGVYSQLSPLALRPINEDVCQQCTTLECYHGSETIAPCPTHLVMGRLKENTYCLSCGNCTQSCPSQNVGWQLRSPSREAISDARPHLDEAFFMLIVFALTLFHGLTMLESWETYLSNTAQILNDNKQFILSFSLGLSLCLALPILIYTACVFLSYKLIPKGEAGALHFKKLFAGFAFVNLPLAFAYHLAHNLNHFVREASDWPALFQNPFGIDTLPLSMMEKQRQYEALMIPETALFVLQTILIASGFFIAVLVVRHRGKHLYSSGETSSITPSATQLFPMLIYAIAATGFSLYLLAQPMTMRM